MSSDGSVRIVFSAGSAKANTRVSVSLDQTPRAVSAVQAYQPLASFTVSESAPLGPGTLSIRYPSAKLPKAVSPKNLIGFVTDGSGGWRAVPVTMDAAAGMLTARFPHFSSGTLGYLKDWALLTNPVTGTLGLYDLGKKALSRVPPDCTKAGSWLGPDRGWSADNPNWEGGRILFNPLQACVEKARPAATAQHVAVANSYTFPFDLSLPASASVSVDDAFGSDHVVDGLLSELYWHLFHATVLSARGESQFSLTASPHGQVLSRKAIADPISIIIGVVSTAVTALSLGEARAQEDALKAALDAVWHDAKEGIITYAKAQADLALGSGFRKQTVRQIAEDHHLTSEQTDKLDQIVGFYDIASCVADDLKDYAPAGNKFDPKSASTALNHIAALTARVSVDCGPVFASELFGEVLTEVKADFTFKQLGDLMESFLDPSDLEEAIEAAVGGVARAVKGANYFGVQLNFTQQPNPNLPPDGPIVTIPLGGSPGFVAVTSDGTTAYVADGSSVKVISLNSDKLIATIPTGTTVSDIVLSPQSDRLYAAAGSSVIAINTQRRMVTARWPVPALSTSDTVGHTLAISPDGRTLYAAAVLQDGLLVIDTTTGETTKYATPDNVYDLLASPDGHRVYALEPGAHKVLVFDTSRRRITKSINLPTDLGPYQGEALTPDGRWLYIADVNGTIPGTQTQRGTVAVVDTTTDQPMPTIPTGHNPTAIATDPDGQRLIALGADGQIIEISTQQRRVTATRKAFSSNEGGSLAVVPGGDRAVLLNTANGEVIVRDLND